MINWKIRFKNPIFYAELFLAVITPVMAYMGITAEDITSWTALLEVFRQAIINPYVLFMVVVSVYNAIVDPTTTGFGDSKTALAYTRPNSDKME